MALVNGTNYDHIDLHAASGGDVTRHKLQDTDGRAMVAPTEASSTASAAHPAGSYFIYNNKLYQATSDIASGGTITPNTNCKEAPLGASISDLKTVFTEISTKNIDNTNGWTVGTLKAADGTTSTSSTRIRTNNFVSVDDSVFGIKTKTGYDFLVYAWNKTSGNYIGCMHIGSVYGTSISDLLWLNEYYFDPTCKYKVILRNADNPSATMTAAEASNCLYVVRAIDKTLAIEGQAADAKKTGDEINVLKSSLFNFADIPGDSLVVPGDFTNTTNVSYSTDAQTGEITVTCTGTGSYSCLQTETTWASGKLIPGKTYILHANATKVSGSPNMRIAIRGTSATADAVAVIVNLNNGENFRTFVADQYMKRVTLFVAFGSSTNDSVSKFSDIWIKEYDTTGIDDTARVAIGDLSSALNNNEKSLEYALTEKFMPNELELGYSLSSEGVKVINTCGACSDSIPIKSGLIFRKPPFKDLNDHSLVLWIHEYNGDTFIKRTALTETNNYLFTSASCDNYKISFQRNVSESIDMTSKDIALYFNVYEFLKASDKIDKLLRTVYPEQINYSYVADGYGIRAQYGDIYSNSNFSATGYIPIIGMNKIRYKRLKVGIQSEPVHGIAFYDENFDYISGIKSDYGAEESTYYYYDADVPNSAYYVRATWLNRETRATFGNFEIFNAEQYDNSATEVLNELKEYGSEISITHAKPDNQGMLNVVRRCRQFTDIKWTPSFDIPRRSQMSGDVVGDTSPIFEDVFKAGTEYIGIPYARATRHASNWGYTDMKVGWTVGLETFISAVMNSESVVAKDSVYDANAHDASFYAIVCAALTSYAYNLDRYYTTAELPSVNGMTFIGNISTMLLSDIKMGDMIINVTAHCAVITDIVTNESGEVTYIEISEATTIGNDDWNVLGSEVGGVCRRKMWSVSDFTAKWYSYKIYRYEHIDNVTYTKSPYVDTGNEGDSIRVVNFPCIPYMGENFRYKVGYIENTKILTPAYKAEQTNKLRVIKDGVPWNVNGTQDYYDVSGAYVNVGFSQAGTYSAYLCKVSNGSEVIKTRSCHWTVS